MRVRKAAAENQGIALATFNRIEVSLNNLGSSDSSSSSRSSSKDETEEERAERAAEVAEIEAAVSAACPAGGTDVDNSALADRLAPLFAVDGKSDGAAVESGKAQALQARDIEYDCCTPARKEPAAPCR